MFQVSEHRCHLLPLSSPLLRLVLVPVVVLLLAVVVVAFQ